MVWAEPGLSSIHYRCKYVSQEAIEREVKKSQDEMTHSSVMTDEFKRTEGRWGWVGPRRGSLQQRKPLDWPLQLSTDVSYISIVLWDETIRLLRVEGYGRSSDAAITTVTA